MITVTVRSSRPGVWRWQTIRPGSFQQSPNAESCSSSMTILRCEPRCRACSPPWGTRCACSPRPRNSCRPRASIALIARYPEQADLFHAGLRQAEISNLRRIAEQDFPFKAGIDVTDPRQVKGLEFDYVILVEVNQSTYPVDDESRHLLHIGATRAAHQLWILTTGKPSELLPRSLRDQEY